MYSNLTRIQRYIARRTSSEEEARKLVDSLARADWSFLFAGQKPAIKRVRQRRDDPEQQAQIEELRKLPYNKYLQTPHWQERRKGAMKRSSFRCQVCNADDKPLNVHHRTYERLGMERNSDIIVLCEGCHAIFHKNGKLATQPEAQEK